MFLETLYQIIYKLGKIDKLPNMPDVLKTINELSILHNDVYQILKTTPNKKKCIDKLNKLKVVNHTEPVFSNEQVLEIIKNKKKIMEPFDTVFYHRTNKTEPSKLHLAYGGSYSKKQGHRFSRIRRAHQTYRKSLKRGGSSGSNAADDEGDAAGNDVAIEVSDAAGNDVEIEGSAATDGLNAEVNAATDGDENKGSATVDDLNAEVAAADKVATKKIGPKLDLTEQISALEKEISELDKKKQDSQNKQRDLEELQLIHELQGIMGANPSKEAIETPEIKTQILEILTKIHDIQEQKKTLGCLKKDFKEGQGIWGYIPDFMRPTGDTGGKFKEYMDMFIQTKDSIVGTAKSIASGLGIDSVCKLINPKVEAKDWVLYPMWSLEQTLYFGEGISVQLDFLSLIVSQLDALYKLGAMSMSGAKMGIIQSALTGLAASTGGVAVAAAPILGPAMGVAYDIGVYLFGNMANIINMFIMISRKKHDGAFTLLTDIIPGMATTLNKAVNFLSILTSLSGKTINLLDNFTALLDSSFLKETFRQITGPITVLPVIGKMVKEKVDLHVFVEANMPEGSFEIKDEMTYKLVADNEGEMVELDPNIKAAYIMNKELYPCILLDTSKDNMIYVGKYYNERFVSSIKRENEPGSPWIEESNNIFIGNTDEEKPNYERTIDDYKKLKDCSYRLFVKDNSIEGSIFHESYGKNDIKSVNEFKRTSETDKNNDPDKYAKYDEKIKNELETSPDSKTEVGKGDTNEEELEEEIIEDEIIDDDTEEQVEEEIIDDDEEEGEGKAGGSTYSHNKGNRGRYNSKFCRNSRKGIKVTIHKKSRKNNSKKSPIHKKLNQYSRKYMYKKRRNVSLRNH